MRIVYVLTSLGVGGAERHTLTLAARMAALGHAVHLLVLRTLPEEWPVALPITRLHMRKSPGSALRGLLRARRALLDLQPDLVHSHGFHANLLARILAASRPPSGSQTAPRPALLSTLHNVYEGGWPRMMAYRLTDGRSTLTTAVSQAVARRFLARKAVSPARCAVVPNAIEIAEYRPDPRRRAAVRAAMGVDHDFLWLAAGRLAPAKDYPNLLRAFALLRAAAQQGEGAQQSAAGPRPRLWIAGQGNARAEHSLRRLAAALELSDCVEWLGLRRDLPALLDAADGFVSSSAWEGMSLAVAEAMAMEKPVVATDAGGLRELVGDCGAVVPVSDPAALAGAMAEVTFAAQLAPSGRPQARQRIAAQFNMETRAREWEEIYRSALAP